MKHISKRKFPKIVCLLIIILSVISCTNTDLRIKGKAKTDQEKVLIKSLGEVVAETLVDDSGQFDLRIKEFKKGYYNINDYSFYLAPGFNLEIDFNDSIPTITGAGAKENNLLKVRMDEEAKHFPYAKEMIAKYQEDIEPYKLYLENLEKELDENLNDKDLDADFVAFEKRRTKTLKSALFSKFVSMHGIDRSKERPSDKYLRSIKPEQFGDPKVMKEFQRLLAIDNKDCYPKEFVNQVTDSLLADFDLNDEVLFSMNTVGYNLLFRSQVSKEIHNERIKNPTAKLPRSIQERDIILKIVTSKPIKMLYLPQLTIQIIKVDPDYAEDAYNLFLEQEPNAQQKEAVDIAYKSFKSIVVGKPSAKFVDYKTPEDKKVSLNDLLGKYVYIDVWATWCAPCKNEIPYLIALEKEFHGRDIEFVSISVDTENNRDKWKKMVADMELKGIQLIADKDFKSEFIKAYNIAAIPRFILIDPQGNIVSPDAKRPSDPSLKMQLNELLK